MLALDSFVPAEGWSLKTMNRFLEIWDNWHLNDMRAYDSAMEADGWHEFLVFDNGTVEGFGDEPLMLMYSFDNESYREIARLRIENEKLQKRLEEIRDPNTWYDYAGPRPELTHDLIGPAIDREVAKHFYSAVTIAG